MQVEQVCEFWIDFTTKSSTTYGRMQPAQIHRSSIPSSSECLLSIIDDASSASPPSFSPNLKDRNSLSTFNSPKEIEQGLFTPYSSKPDLNESKDHLEDELEEPLDTPILEADDDFDGPRKSVLARVCHPTFRGFVNIMTLVLILLSLIMLFLGYPILAHLRNLHHRIDVNNNLKEVEENFDRIPIRGLVDKDTPDSVKTRKSDQDGSTYKLVFSDEFEKPGRTFWPGDDPFWEAVDIWYGGTGNLEWYTPEGINTTKTGDGKGVLQITMEEAVERKQYFRSGMLQSWNKFCFQGGYIEAAIQFPGGAQTKGYWPGFWLMGNLGRAGYLASTEGMWPYSYDECDVGARENQTFADGKGPAAALGKRGSDSHLSGLPGMRYPSCTCKNEDHPGPTHKVARSAPEIDIVELQMEKQKNGSYASQSYQVAPFDDEYSWDRNKTGYQVWNRNERISFKNPYKGGLYQQSVSVLSRVDDSAFEMAKDPTFTKVGVEYEPDWENKGEGYLTFYLNGKRSWSIWPGTLAQNDKVQIGRRAYPKEPMSIILNLGISSTFQEIGTFAGFRLT